MRTRRREGGDKIGQAVEEEKERRRQKEVEGQKEKKKTKRSASRTEMAAPPRVSPSSLVRIAPVMPMSQVPKFSCFVFAKVCVCVFGGRRRREGVRGEKA